MSGPSSRSVAFLCSGLVLLGLGAAGGCSESGAPARGSRWEGRVLGPEAAPGDAYLFLFDSGQGPPDSQGTPRYVTAVSGLRRASGDSRYVFAEVKPGAYRLWGFLDSNGDVDLTVDVLAQPGAGDWVPDAGVEREPRAGEDVSVDLSLARRVRHSAPAFRVTGEAADGGVVSLTDSPALVSFGVEADGLGLLQGEAPRFFVRFRDADGDGTADDVDGDGVPDLFPQFFLRWVPRPGQWAPGDAGSEPPQVVVPLLFNPVEFITLLQGDVTREVAAEQLQLFVVPQARVVTQAPDAGTVTAPLAAIPPGEYELWALSAEGSFWHVPNALGSRDAGALASQALRFRVVRGSSADAGGLGGPGSLDPR